MPAKKKRGRPRKVVEPKALASAAVPLTTALSEPQPGRGRKKLVRKSAGTSEISFTVKEKKAFFDCLTKNGFNVIYDMAKLQEALPKRSENEIKFLIESYTRKSKEKVKREDTLPSSVNPIQKWYSIINQLVPAGIKKDDMSGLLVDILHKFGKDFYLDEMKQVVGSAHKGDEQYKSKVANNYQQIYLYISEALDGKCPPELAPADALVIIKLMDELNEAVASKNCTQEKMFLKSAKWWDEKAASDLANGVCNSQNQGVDSPGESSSSQLVGSQNSLPNERLGLESNMNLPKIRKISECLNPLQVPTQLLIDESKRFVRKAT